MRKHELFFVLACGSAWGIVEATLGAGLHLAHVPLAGTVMASIGFAFLLAALHRGFPPLSLAAVSLVAAAWKFFDVLILGLPPFDPGVIRPALAIASQGLAFTLIAGRRWAWSRPFRTAPLLLVTVAASMALFRAASYAVYGQSHGRIWDGFSSVLLELALTTIAALAFFAVLSLAHSTKAKKGEAAES